MDEPKVRLTVQVRGRVQGVGFRYWVQSRASAMSLTGSAANLPDGSVEVVAEGPGSACQRLLEALRGPDSPGHVTEVREEWSSPRDVTGFTTR